MKKLCILALVLMVSISAALAQVTTTDKIVENIGKTTIANHETLIPAGYVKNHQVNSGNGIEFIYYKKGTEFIKYEFHNKDLRCVYISDDDLMGHFYSYNFERGLFETRNAIIHHNTTLDNFAWAIYNKNKVDI